MSHRRVGRWMVRPLTMAWALKYGDADESYEARRAAFAACLCDPDTGAPVANIDRELERMTLDEGAQIMEAIRDLSTPSGNVSRPPVGSSTS